MGFHLESGRNNEIKEVPDNQINSEKLSETEETAENFDDCSLSEVQDNSDKKVNSETMEDAEDNFEDCKAKLGEIEEESPELAEGDSDDFEDCGKEIDDGYAAEVTYTSDGEISHEEARCAYEEAQDHLEEQQETAEEYEEQLEERMENAEALSAMKGEQSDMEAEMSKKFADVMSMERGTDEYRQALQEYNSLKDQKEAFDEKVAALTEQQDLLEKKSLELREAQIAKGEAAAAASAETLAGVKILEGRFDEEYYSSRPNRAELRNLREDNSTAIKELSDEKASLKLAVDAKMEQISDYVITNRMSPYGTSTDPYYRQLAQEYQSLKAAYDRVGYSIVKLDENNISISETLGEAYHTMRELPRQSAITEVAQGQDIPHETNYFIDEARASEVLPRFKQDEWERLSLREQKQAIEQLADYNAEILGVEEKPQIVYYRKEDPGVFGGYSSQLNAIYINEYNINDAAEAADTISHEYRHKYQHERAEKLENERDLAFKEGFDNYICAEDDYQGYKAQFVEVDARAYAQAVKDKIASCTKEFADTAQRKYNEKREVAQ